MKAVVAALLAPLVALFLAILLAVFLTGCSWRLGPVQLRGGESFCLHFGGLPMGANTRLGSITIAWGRYVCGEKFEGPIETEENASPAEPDPVL